MKLRTLAILLLLSGPAAAQVYEEDLKGISLDPAAGDSRTLILTWQETGLLHDEIAGVDPSEVYYDIRISREEPPWAPYWDDSWYLDADPLEDQPPYAPETGDGFIAIGALEPGRTYYIGWRIEVIAPDGTYTTDVSTVSATTSTDSSAPSAIAGLVAQPDGAGALALTWTATGDDGNSGRARRYDLRWSPKDPSQFPTPAAWYAAATAAAVADPLEAGMAEATLLEGLPSATRIYAAIRAADEIPNWSAVSAIASAETSAPAPAPPGSGGGNGGCSSSAPQGRGASAFALYQEGATADKTEDASGSAAAGLLAILLLPGVFLTRPAALR